MTDRWTDRQVDTEHTATVLVKKIQSLEIYLNQFLWKQWLSISYV